MGLKDRMWAGSDKCHPHLKSLLLLSKPSRKTAETLYHYFCVAACCECKASASVWECAASLSLDCSVQIGSSPRAAPFLFFLPFPTPVGLLVRIPTHLTHAAASLSTLSPSRGARLVDMPRLREEQKPPASCQQSLWASDLVC